MAKYPVWRNLLNKADRPLLKLVSSAQESTTTDDKTKTMKTKPAATDAARRLAAWKRHNREMMDWHDDSPLLRRIDRRTARRAGSFEGEVLTRANAYQIATKLGISLNSTRRWARTRKIPAMWRVAVRAVVLGDLGAIHAEWRGWTITDNGELVAPEAGEYAFKRSDLMSLPWFRRMFAAHRAAYRPPATEPAQADWIECKYVTPAIMAPTVEDQLAAARKELEAFQREWREAIDRPQHPQVHLWGQR